MNEIKHVMGMYDYLDTLVRENPDLMLDVCAGTGSRVDFEIMRRALNLTRSDGAWWNPIGDQSKTYGYSFWSPITGIGAVAPTAYDFRSGLGAHITTCFDFNHASPETWDNGLSLIGEYEARRRPCPAQLGRRETDRDECNSPNPHRPAAGPAGRTARRQNSLQRHCAARGVAAAGPRLAVSGTRP